MRQVVAMEVGRCPRPPSVASKVWCFATDQMSLVSREDRSQQVRFRSRVELTPNLRIQSAGTHVPAFIHAARRREASSRACWIGTRTSSRTSRCTKSSKEKSRKCSWRFRIRRLQSSRSRLTSKDSELSNWKKMKIRLSQRLLKDWRLKCKPPLKDQLRLLMNKLNKLQMPRAYRARNQRKVKNLLGLWLRSSKKKKKRKRLMIF